VGNANREEEKKKTKKAVLSRKRTKLKNWQSGASKSKTSWQRRWVPGPRKKKGQENDLRWE